MKNALLAAVLLSAFAGPAFADSKPTDEEVKKITEAISAAGYSGGKFEKESEATGVYEAEDVKDKSGTQFDIKLDKDFKILSITRD